MEFVYLHWYCKLSCCTKADVCPMPQIDDRIDQMGQTKYFSMLVLSRDYWQVPVVEEDRCTTPYGLYQFQVILFGLCTAPATFTQIAIVEHVLQCFNDCVTAYIDDVIFYNKNWSDHLKHISLVL